MEKTKYIYVDRLENGDNAGEIIYIGKGSDGRIKAFKRNVKYNRKYLKYGIKREIVFETKDEELALKEEIRLIAEHHTYYKDPLSTKNACNLTKGGEGRGKSFQAKENISQRTKEAMANMKDQSWKARQKTALADPAVRAKISERTKLAMQRHEVKIKIENRPPNFGSFKTGHIVSEEIRKKISKNRKGYTAHNKGKKLSEEARKKISENTRKAMSRPDVKENLANRKS